MKYRLKPIIKNVVSILEKERFFIERMRGDHIIINKKPPLRRPIVLVNVKKPSNIVRQNLISACREAGINEETIQELNELLRY
jgi:predicted RNA binding protein YcfA (HicA-like mRNA interferase family)